MDAGSNDLFLETVTDLWNAGHGLIHEVGPEGLAVDIGNHCNGAAKQFVHYVDMFSVYLNATSRAIITA